MEDAAGTVVAAAAAGGRTYTVSDGHPPLRGDYVALLATQLRVAPPPFEGGSGLGKRVSNARAIRELSLCLAYPSCRDGLAAALR